MTNIILTDDFRISINQAIDALKGNDKKMFTNAVKYILKKLEYREYDVFTDYLWDKFRRTNDRIHRQRCI